MFIDKDPEIKILDEWEIWSEGYVAQGSESKANFHGKYKANSFAEACVECFKNSPDGYFVARDLTHWGCKLHDNEADARVSFG